MKQARLLSFIIIFACQILNFIIMNNLITPQLKDELLSDLLSANSMQVQVSAYEWAKELNVSPDIICPVFDQFEELGFINQTKCMGSLLVCQIKAKAHDFMRHGGFSSPRRNPHSQPAKTKQRAGSSCETT